MMSANQESEYEKELQCWITACFESGHATLVSPESQHVYSPFEQKCNEVGIYWQQTDPALWKALCKKKHTELRALLNKAEQGKSDDLINQLKAMSMQLHEVLKNDRVRGQNTQGDVLKREVTLKDMPVKLMVSVTKDREDAILKWLELMGHDPLAIPKCKNGFAGIKKECRDGFCAKYKISEKVFDTAWDKLRSYEKIMDAM